MLTKILVKERPIGMVSYVFRLCNPYNLWRWGLSSFQVGDTKLHRAWCPKFATGLYVFFMTISSHFLANYMNKYLLQKTEIQIAILRCWTGLKLNWSKRYDTNANKHKTTKTAINITQICCFSKWNKKGNGITKVQQIVSYLLNPLILKPVQHLKITIWMSVLWKIFM